MMKSPAGRWVIDVQQQEAYSPSASSMSELARKKENADSNQPITDDGNKVIIPLTGSPEEWEWDRLLEEMENDDNKKK